MLVFLLLNVYAGLSVDADSPCDLVQVHDVLQLGSHYFILDHGDTQVKVVDAAGELLYHFGQKGEGPGEFQNLAAMGIVNGEIWIHDLIQSQVQRFTPKGKYLGVHKLAALGPLQFEAPYILLHTPTQLHSFTVLDQQFKETGNLGKGLDASGRITMEQVIASLQVFTVDPDQNVLYTLGVNGQSITVYDLKTMAQTFTGDLPLKQYASPKKVKDGEGRVRTRGGRPIQSTLFHQGHLYTLIHDEAQKEHSRVVTLDLKGKIIQNKPLDAYFTGMIANPEHGTAFFLNVDDSVIEERPLGLDSK